MRYLLLVLLCSPFIAIAYVNLLTVYKTGKMTKQKFTQQITYWTILFVCLVGSFPLYNYFQGRPLLDSQDLSLFDIIQTAIIIFLLYSLNTLRRKQDETERRLRDLHQELSITLSEK